MQINPAGTWYRAIAMLVSITVWSILFQYKERGMKLLGGLAKGKIAEPSELGSWYANNITGNASAMLFSTVLYGLVPLSFGFTVFIPAPLDFPALLDFTWMALPIFLAIGFVAGIDVRNRWLDVVDPEPDDEKDAS